MVAEPLTRLTPRVPAGIVHLGLGAFFRAHGAIYVEDAAKASGGDWGIIGVSLRSPGTRDLLKPQGGAYLALELGPQTQTVRRVEIVREVLVAPEAPGLVLEAMASPNVGIVTLTVTEKGYCHEPATGRLNPDHPDIIHDIANPLPLSAPGYLVRALQVRRQRGLVPFTVLSCDNLPGNGTVVRNVVLAVAERIDPALAGWIASEGRFPSSMVDRIVPATTPRDIAAIEAISGMRDAAPVAHEPFRQWVIEDDFVGGIRPDLAAAGAQMVSDVTPFEHMKLRMLNGTHSSLAYLGYLAGHETIADCMADPVLANFVRRLWTDEIIPALEPPQGIDLAGYARQLEQRYANPAIRHRTWQIAMDGSQKLPQRILGTLRANLAGGRKSPRLLLAVAGWMIYVSGSGLDGGQIDVRDPLAARLKAAATSKAPVDALLSISEIFPPELALALRDELVGTHARLKQSGARAAMEQLS